MLDFSLSELKDFRKFSNYLEKQELWKRTGELNSGQEAKLRMCVYWGAG